jgi:hypothetical protein
MYLVIECWPALDVVYILSDSEGEKIIFPTRPDAERAARECQNGLILEL